MIPLTSVHPSSTLDFNSAPTPLPTLLTDPSLAPPTTPPGQPPVIRIHTLGCLSVRGGDGAPLSGAAAQPRRMAILALLARAGERGMLREKVLALIWPDADGERGSRTLAQALYALRKDLVADDAIVGSKELRFDPALVTSDVSEFASAIARGDDARAVAVYDGPFLDGFHIASADEFSRWVERERMTLAQEHARALESLARRALTDGDPAGSVDWWKRLAGLEPLNARVTVGLMEALAAAGDRAAAIKQARIYELLVEQELDLPPDREVRAFADRLRRGANESQRSVATAAGRSASVAATASSAVTAGTPPVARMSSPSVSVITRDEPRLGNGSNAPPELVDDAEAADLPVAVPAPSQVRATPVETRAASRSRYWRVAAVLVGVATVWLAATRTPLGRLVGAAPNESPAVVAVGRIVSYGDSATAALAEPVADLLATSLARSPGLRVVSAGRMLDLMRRTRTPGDTSAAGVVTAAREAGATELIDGTLYSRPEGTLRLDLRRVNLATGSIDDVQSIEGSDVFTLVDSGTARLVAAHGSATPLGSIAGLTTRSVAAYSLYVEGLRTLRDGDGVAAERLFGAALREDSTFAMAAYYYGRSATLRVPMVHRLSRALRLSANATERERLMIRAGWAVLVFAPELSAVADSLVTRYPQETEGHLYAGLARTQDGEFIGAIPHFRRVVEMDSLSFSRSDSAAACDACTAMFHIVTAYVVSDSLAAAEREARRWTRLQPKTAAPWTALWDVLERAGKFTEAAALTEQLASVDRDPVAALTRASTHALRTGDLTSGERMVRAALQAANTRVRNEAMWQLILSLRYQGRTTDAIAEARRYRVFAQPLDSGPPKLVSPAAAPLAASLAEAGRYREAAALFDSISYWRAPDDAPSAWARERVWRLTQEARALAAAGDTAAVAALADTITVVGRRSGHVRDRRLNHYVRGLLLRARKDLVGAEAEFRSAIFSWPAGYTATNYDLALVLLELNRPREAITVLQPALRGKVDASNFYVTHTQTHELLARAWDAAGRPDSAAVHHAWVARAWENGDAPYRERAALARRRSSR